MSNLVENICLHNMALYVGGKENNELYRLNQILQVPVVPRDDA